MNKSHTHYERAFEDFLRQQEIPYVMVDQAQKAVFAGVRIKSFDFIVYPRRGPSVLIDVKGRKLAWGLFQRGRLGETWITDADLDGLGQWEKVFGEHYIAVLVFAYWLYDAPLAAADERVHRHRERAYSFVAAELAAYQVQARTRSPRWRTVYVPARRFARLAQPFGEFLLGAERSESRSIG